MDPAKESLLDVPATAARLREVALRWRLDEKAQERAFALADLVPDAPTWARWLDRFLLGLGAALVLAGIAAFFAYNWADLHRLVKLALVEAGIVLGAVAAWRAGLDTLVGRAALFAAAFLTGTLFAVYGQAYQTGADPYGLFLTWAVVILPWVLIGRQAALWLLLVILANLALMLYWVQVLHPPAALGQDFARELGPLFWIIAIVGDQRLAEWLFALNVVAVVGLELWARMGAEWLSGRWMFRIIGLLGLAAITDGALHTVLFSAFDSNTSAGLSAPLLFAGACGAMLWYYQRQVRDLFMLAAMATAVIVVVTAFIARAVFEGDPGGGAFLLLSLVVLGQTVVAAVWLGRVARRWRGTK